MKSSVPALSPGQRRDEPSKARCTTRTELQIALLRRFVVAIRRGDVCQNSSLRHAGGHSPADWFQRGSLRWREDVVPTVPLFAVALAMGLVTAWLEKAHVGAQGPDYVLSFSQRGLIAGRAFWFYLGKLLWPPICG
jgi:hypothetical protein